MQVRLYLFVSIFDPGKEAFRNAQFFYARARTYTHVHTQIHTHNTALNLPLFRHYLKLIGTINASSSSCKKYLDKGWSLGISSGGVAEIFCANDPDEVIIMKDRKGECV